MRSIAESDLGTPKSPSTETVALKIDGVDVRVPAGTSVLRAASEAGITIPKLCATELLDAFGSCRLCLVEIEGMRGYPASCTTPVTNGMKVKTQSGKLGQLRRGVMELYLSDHPLAAIAHPPGGRTEIEEMAKLVAEAFARKMSEADLKGVADFFKSPLGQTYSKMRGEAMNDVLPVLQPWSVQTSNYLFDRLSQEMRKRGHTL